MPKATQKPNMNSTQLNKSFQKKSSVNRGRQVLNKNRMLIKKLLSVHLKFATSAFILYIEGPKMDWTVNDSLYNRFIKWKIKCENILECELAMLSESRKCKKGVAWSGDFGIGPYVSSDLPPEEVCLQVIWKKFEEFCKPLTNEIRARFDLLTSFRQGDHSVDEWYNAVQNQINLARYPQETARILQRDIFED